MTELNRPERNWCNRHLAGIALWMLCTVALADAPTYPMKIQPLVLNASEWSKEKVNAAVADATAIYRRQCGLVLETVPPRSINVPPAYRALSEPQQASLIRHVIPDSIPVFFVFDSTDAHKAYAYLSTAPVASRGTVWITRHADNRCLPRTLAHELGHILLNQSSHHPERANLMHFRCVASNFQGASIGRNLTPAQCAKVLATN